MKLDDLPPEVLIEVFRSVSPRDLWLNVRPACKYFSRIIENERYWKSLIRVNYGVILPECQLSQKNFNLPLCCIKIHEEQERWDYDRLLSPLNVVAHTATADAVMLMRTSSHKQLCVSGARDRTIRVWDLGVVASAHKNDAQYCSTSQDTVKHDKWTMSLEHAHEGWIWSLCPAGTDSFFSCGWDCFVKSWRIADRILPVYQRQLASAVFCVVNDGDMTACSTFNRNIYVFDVRQHPDQEIVTLKHHNCIVFELAQNPVYLYSCSKDKRIACVDKRTWGMIAYHETSSFSQTISLKYGQLLCGTMDGKLITLNPRTMEVIEEYSISNVSSPVRQVRMNLGSKMCIARNRRLRVYTAGIHSKLIAQSEDFNYEPSRFDYLNGNLVVASGRGSLKFWLR